MIPLKTICPSEILGSNLPTGWPLVLKRVQEAIFHLPNWLGACMVGLCVGFIVADLSERWRQRD